MSSSGSACESLILLWDRFPWHPRCNLFNPRGVNVSRALQCAARWQRAAQLPHQQQQHQQHQAGGSSTLSCTAGSEDHPALDSTKPQTNQFASSRSSQHALLVPVALHADAAFLQDIAAAVTQHNAAVQEQLLHTGQQQHRRLLTQESAAVATLQTAAVGTSNRNHHQAQLQLQQQQPSSLQLLTPLLLRTVQFAAAAATIQSCWRSHHIRLKCGVADAALAARAVRVIQRAWRACELTNQQRVNWLSVWHYYGASSSAEADCKENRLCNWLYVWQLDSCCVLLMFWRGEPCQAMLILLQMST